MAYNEFTLNKVQEAFNLTLNKSQNLFSAIESIQPSNLLQMILDEYLSLAIDINSEKARSDFIIVPVLEESKSLD